MYGFMSHVKRVCYLIDCTIAVCVTHIRNDYVYSELKFDVSETWFLRLWGILILVTTPSLLVTGILFKANRHHNSQYGKLFLNGYCYNLWQSLSQSVKLAKSLRVISSKLKDELLHDNLQASWLLFFDSLHSILKSLLSCFLLSSLSAICPYLLSSCVPLSCPYCIELWFCICMLYFCILYSVLYFLSSWSLT